MMKIDLVHLGYWIIIQLVDININMFIHLLELKQEIIYDT